MQGKYKVHEVMERNIIVSSKQNSILYCSKVMAKNKIGCVVIVEEHRVVGIITEQDILRKVVACELDPKHTCVEKVMSRNIVFVESLIELQSAIQLMGNNQIKHLPVIDNGELVGLVTSKDIVAIEPLLIEYLKFNNSVDRNNFEC